MYEPTTESELYAHYAGVKKRLNSGPPPKVEEPPVEDTLLSLLQREHPEQAIPIPKALNPILTLARAASRHSGYSVADITQDGRKPALVRIRHIVMYLGYRMTSYSFPEVGRHLGDRDHSTIQHGVNKMERLRQIDERLADDIEAIRALAVMADPSLGLVTE